MTVSLEIPFALGDRVVAVLVRNTISQSQSSRHIAVTGDRSPVAVLIRQGDQVGAFTPEGDALTPAEVETLCPGALARLASTPTA